MDDLQPGYAFGQLDRAIIMNPNQVNARIVLPVTTYEQVMKGYPVDMVLYANNYEEIDEDHPIIERFDTVESALRVFREGTAMSKGTTTSTGGPDSAIAGKAIAVTAIADDSGVSTTDFITNDPTLTLAPFFETVVTSQSCGFAKPDPRILHVALDTMGVRPRHALYVGDDPTTDGGAARAAGVRFVWMDHGKQACGRRPTRRVETLRELAGLLARDATASPRGRS